ncbi:MAG: hypothetical protein WEB00_04125 [Dehalococcoidia bacterium]
MPLRLVLLLASLLLVAACGGGGGGGDGDNDNTPPEEDTTSDETLSLEDYLTTLDEIGDGADEAQLETETLAEFFELVKDTVDEVEDLEPPDDVNDEHEAYLDALHTFEDELDAFLQENEGLSEDELNELETPGIDDAAAEIEDACGDLQQIADDEEIDVNLECTGEDGGASPTAEEDKTPEVDETFSSGDGDDDDDQSDGGGSVENDDIANATNVDSLPFEDTLDVDGATTEADEPQPSCTTTPISQSVWYSFQSEVGGAITVETAGSTYDTVMAVYEPGQSDLIEVACNDDVELGNSTSAESFSSVAGGVYFVQISVYGDSDPGTLQLSIAAGGGNTAGANDDIGDATLISSLPFSDSIDTSGFTTIGVDPEASCGFAGDSASAWYVYVPEATGDVLVTTLGSDYDTLIAVYEGGIGTLDEVACNDDSLESIAEVIFSAQAGTTYYIQVSAFGASGGGNLQLDIADAP